MIEKQITSNGILDKTIESLIEERLFYTACGKTQEKAEYDKLRKELIYLGDSIKNLMGSKQSVFEQYEESSTLYGNTLRQNSYRQGFTDGLKLLKDILFLGQ
ncbi:hypothetical protein [Desulfosporosinus hippei]|uniref:Uncharacterized protein n=1 Tax=Desulfosporosinus hippei DSM 8344 TaxID=1121419 RepID=A0A1G7UHK4_9FIRM|nr:hypothetical protein [Desulfosporosinus hippei]SDG46967.1 hypothetical protein SAMN05443529_103145 [Desulfosporosinus hippei DSM 8344]